MADVCLSAYGGHVDAHPNLVKCFSRTNSFPDFDSFVSCPTGGGDSRPFPRPWNDRRWSAPSRSLSGGFHTGAEGHSGLTGPWPQAFGCVVRTRRPRSCGAVGAVPRVQAVGVPPAPRNPPAGAWGRPGSAGKRRVWCLRGSGRGAWHLGVGPASGLDLVIKMPPSGFAGGFCVNSDSRQVFAALAAAVSLAGYVATSSEAVPGRHVHDAQN